MTTNYNIKNRNHYFITYSLLYLTLLIGFFFDENSTGGAILDYTNQKNISIAFSKDFIKTLLHFDEYQTRHSPIFIIFLSLFERLNFNDFTIRFIHLHLSLILPLIFYLCIKEKFKIQKYNEIFCLFVGIIFLSPTFRSLSIWPDSRLFGIIFFLF